MEKRQGDGEIGIILTLCFILGFFMLGSPKKGSNNNNNEEYKNGERDIYTVSTTQEDYDRIGNSIENLIKANNGKIEKECDWKRSGISKPLRSKEWAIELAKDDFKNFVKDFRSLEGEGDSFSISSKEIVNQDGKNTKKINIVFSEYIDQNKFMNSVLKYVTILFIIAISYASFVTYKINHPWLF